ncbi:hypothetical protein BKA82DRAFT_125854 [Pisolithus tinctorius]|uniref:DNA-directed RNA polymerase n=1 Tax=Pisolithus tinctorius Marx 270 TaxID=870435 RepID=A0A0C3KR32_PISTI|nr:hypothetical protein BKA82DRAFT_125854 [Pisolithus tinctorius]KIO11992.1 hypothetical protein M404DRAFT_125854 [Pisolithus tinctorius Marx 270]
MRKERALETDSVNLKAAMCIPGVGFSPMYSNNCIESFTTLRVEAVCATIMKELRGAFKFDGSYVNYRHLALPCDLLTHHRMLMAITHHGINYPDTGALMRCSFEEMVEILMEAAAIGENNDCHSIMKKAMFSQLVPMGTGAFDVTLDINILKDTIIDHCLPVQNTLTAHSDCSMTPSQVAMMPYDMNSPAWSESNFKGKSVALSPLAVNGGEDPTNFSFLGYWKSPLGAGDMSPASPPGYSLSSPNAYSPTSPYVPQSPYGGTTSFGMLVHATSPFYDRSQGATSPTYFLMSPALNLMSPCYLPTSPRYSPQPPSFIPTSPQYSPTGLSAAPAQMSPLCPKYLPTSPVPPSSPKYSNFSKLFSGLLFLPGPVSPAYSPTSP